MNIAYDITKWVCKKAISKKKNPIKEMIENPENYILTAEFKTLDDLEIHIRKKDNTGD